MSKGSNTQTTQSSSSVAPNPEAMAAYQALLKRAQGVSETPYQAYGGPEVAPINAQQYYGVGNINTGAGGFSPYAGQAGYDIASGAGPVSSADIAQYMDPYTSQVINATQADFDTQNKRAQSAVTGNAAAQGALGGNRVGVAQALTQEGQERVQAPVIAGLRSQGFQSAEQMANAQKARAIQGGQALSGANLQNAMAQFGVGTAEQQTEQAKYTQAMTDYYTAQGYPFATAQWLASLVLPTGAQMGSTTTGSSTTEGPRPNTWAQGAGLALSGLALFSDKRLKENVKEIGRLHDGQKVYRYNFKGDPTTHVGLISQEVEKTHPEAVEKVGGFGAVDYDAATEDAIKRWSGGAIHGFAPGGAPYGESSVIGAQGWVPTVGGIKGTPLQPTPFPQHAKLSDQKGIDTDKMGKQIGMLGKQAYDWWNKPTLSMAGETDAGSLADWTAGFSVAEFKSGGRIKGFADGGEANGQLFKILPANQENNSLGLGENPQNISDHILGQPTGSAATPEMGDINSSMQSSYYPKTMGPMRSASSQVAGFGDTNSSIPGSFIQFPRPMESLQNTLAHSMTDGIAMPWTGQNPTLQSPTFRTGIPISSGFGGGSYAGGGGVTDEIDMSDEPPIHYTPSTPEDRIADYNALRLSAKDPDAGNQTVASNIGLVPRPDTSEPMAEPSIVDNAQAIFKKVAPGLGARRSELPSGVLAHNDSDAIDMSARSRVPVPGVASQGPGMGGFNPLGLGDEARQGLISMGLRMMANRRGGPGSFLASMGEGGEQGMSTYASAKALTAAQAAQARKEAFEREKFETPYTKQTKEQDLRLKELQSQHEFMRAKTIEGLRLKELQINTTLRKPVLYRKDARGNEYYAIPRVGAGGEVEFWPIDPKTGEVGSSPLGGSLKENANRTLQQNQQPNIATPVAMTEEKALSAAPPLEIRSQELPASPKARNDAYLKYLEQDIGGIDGMKYAQLIKGIADYKINPNALFSLRSNARQKGLEDVLAYDPTYDQRRYNQTNRAISGWAQSPEGRATRSLSVIVEHLATLDELGKALQNNDVQTWNKFKNYLKTEFGYGGPPSFDAAKVIVGDEIAKAIIGGQNAEADRAGLQQKLSSANSPEQLQSVIDTFKELMAGQVVGLKQTYEAATGLHNFDGWLTPRARDAINDLMIERDRKVRLEQQKKFGVTKKQNEDQKALDWANANPTDPRSATIKKRLGVQ